MTHLLAKFVVPAAALWLGIIPVPATSGPEGVWLTPPDRKGQTAHVDAKKCGVAYCGTIVTVFAPSGEPISAATVGQRVFWDMIGSSDVYEGRAFVPAHNRNYNARMRVNGNRMTVSGCLGLVCQSQIWLRVR
ncbi:DUF2147 domain-containing protein [uncultured Tateyamaria sp.]|uniref:DUF2147 domain-containing protein n=1 Tax=uncultured Tateyamaria sp. TaxID=455651 RepID=UPI0026309B2B|nr:DUF2147 domain-containing protein [uncultured Tateyamaria sp.]